LHHEGRDAALPLFGRGRGHHHVDVSDRPLRDEHLGAVQHPRVAVAHGARAQRRRVAAGAGLGEAPGAQPLPARHARQVAAADRLLDVAVLVGEREVHHAARGRMLARIQSTISCVEAPGVKTLATPARARAGMSSSGMMPPPKTSLSPPPRWRSSSTTAGKSVRWAPERIESPTASTASWMAAAATISGVWWRPV